MTSALASDVREYDWHVRQATRERLIIPVLDDGEPATIAGWTVDAKVKTAPGGTVLYTWPTSDIAIVGHEVILTIPAPVSAAWTWGTSWYRVKLIDPGSSVDNPAISRVLQGALVLDLD
jgi:hypothetical protein